MTDLLAPVRLGDVDLANRVVLVPTPYTKPLCTRVPRDALRSFYAQRASAGLIISEAASVSPLGISYGDAPGIWNTEQMQAWREIVDAVHERNGRIFLRLCHAGRVSDPDVLSGEIPVAPSALGCARQASAYAPRSLHANEIDQIVEDFELAARHAYQAGFDGVQIQAGDGYLIDQFLHDGSNHRRDHYGGDLDGRSRFLLETVDACIGVWGSGRVSVHLTPADDRNGMKDSNRSLLYEHVLQELAHRQPAFLSLRVPASVLAMETKIPAHEMSCLIHACEDIDMARKILSSGLGDAVAFGKLFVSNPDLVDRLHADRALRPCPQEFVAV